MDEETRRLLDRANETAERAIRQQETHEKFCTAKWAANERQLAALETAQHDMRDDAKALAEELKDGVRLVGESLRQQNEALGNRMEMLSQRQSNTASSVIDSVNQTMNNFKELMDKAIDVAAAMSKGTSDALTAFINAQTETNRQLNNRTTGLDDRADALAASLTQHRESTDSRIAAVRKETGDDIETIKDRMFNAILVIAGLFGSGLLAMILKYIFKW